MLVGLAIVGTETENSLDLSFLFVGTSVSYIDTAVGDRGAAVARADRHGPSTRNHVARKAGQQSVNAESRVAILAAPLWPVLGP